MRQIILILSLFISYTLTAQSANDIKNNPNVYIWGEGEGSSLRLADEKALVDLSSQIVSHVTGKKRTDIINIQDGNDAKSNVSFEEVMETYTSATLTNTQRFVLQNEPIVKVLRYIKKTEIDKIFARRIETIKEFVRVADEAERLSKIDDAIRYYYWANMLMNSLRPSDDVQIPTSDGEKSASIVVSNKLKNIFSNLKVSVKGKQITDNNYELIFTYKNKPVASLDFTYWIGNDWSCVNSVLDGIGVVELRPGYFPDKLQIKYECLHYDDSYCDNEVKKVLETVNEINYPEATVDVPMSNNELSSEIKMSAKKDEVGLSSQTNVTLERNDAVEKSTNSFLTVELMDEYKKVVYNIINSINSKNYTLVQNYFTNEGLDIFNRLIKYGNARVVGQNFDLTFVKVNKSVLCRSVPMRFSFSKKRNFMENVIFEFDEHGKIDNIAFGLSKVAQDDIFDNDKTNWNQDAKQIVISFLENYKTAYALGRIDYLESIFADDALIISGKVLQKYTGSKEFGYNQNRYVQLTKHTKSEYIKRLRTLIDKKEYINIKFANNEIVKTGKSNDIYAIQIKQDYFSDNYGDSGYLFLMVDVSEPKEPVIHVRVWQENPDPSWGIIGPGHF